MASVSSHQFWKKQQEMLEEDERYSDIVKQVNEINVHWHYSAPKKKDSDEVVQTAAHVAQAGTGGADKSPKRKKTPSSNADKTKKKDRR